MRESSIRRLKIVRLTGKQFILFLVMILLAVIPALPFTVFNYLDEILGVISGFYILKKIKTVGHNKHVRTILYCLICTAFLGLLSNLTSGVKTNIFGAFIDCFGVIKNHLIFISTIFILNDKGKDKIFKALYPITVIVVYICFFCGIINLFASTPWSYDVRYGINSFEFFFSNPAALGQLMIVALAVFDNVESKLNLHKVIALVVMILTLRSGIMAIVFIYMVLTLFMKHTKKIRWYHIVLLGIGAFAVGFGMIKEYYLSRNTLRYTLLHYGIVVSKRFFPLGSGFATYGSQMAYDYYSPLYYEFGFDNMWGLNKTYGGMVNDNYWPMVLAQIGIIGAMAQVILLIAEFLIVITQHRKSIDRRMAQVLFLNLVISTMASANLTGVAGTVCYFALGLLLSCKINITNKEVIV